MKRSAEDEFDRVTLWALAATVFTIFLGTLFSRDFHLFSWQGALFCGGLGTYIVLLYHYDHLVLKSPRWGALLYYSAQWLLYVSLSHFVPSDLLWLMVMPVISQAAGWLRWPASLLVGSCFLAAMMWIFQDGNITWEGSLRRFPGIAVAFIFTGVFTVAAKRALDARKLSDDLAAELEAANVRLHAAAEQTAALAAAHERNRIAGDIHDGLGHHLTVLTVQLQAAQVLLSQDPARAAEALAKAEEMNRAALEEVRRSVGALRNGAEKPPLPKALRGLIAECEGHVELSIHGPPRELPEAVEHAIFRTVQEGLTNARKHARASQLEIILDFSHPGSTSIVVQDDGLGCSGEIKGGFGLVGLRERLESIGGSLSAGNRADRGFLLRAEVPA